MRHVRLDVGEAASLGELEADALFAVYLAQVERVIAAVDALEVSGHR